MIKDTKNKRPVPDTDEKGNNVITMRYLQEVCEFDGGYKVPHLNEILYINMQHFKKIEGLEQFYNIRSLFLEGNNIEKIEGISHLHNLHSLYLQNNVISKIEGLDRCSLLHILNVSNNVIPRIDNIKHLSSLSILEISNNRLSTLDSISNIEYNTNLTMVNLKDNRIPYDDNIITLLSGLHHLSYLDLKGNDFVRMCPHYRKTMFNRLQSLVCLEGEHRSLQVNDPVELDKHDDDRSNFHILKWRGEAKVKEMRRAQSWREELIKATDQLNKLRELHIKLQKDNINNKDNRVEELSIEQLEKRMIEMINDDSISPEEKTQFRKHIDDRIMRHKLGIEIETPLEANELAQEWAEDRINECMKNISACEAQARVYSSQEIPNMLTKSRVPDIDIEDVIKLKPQQYNIDELMEEKINWTKDLDEDLEAVLIESNFDFESAANKFNIRLDGRRKREGRRIVHQTKSDLIKRWTCTSNK